VRNTLGLAILAIYLVMAFFFESLLSPAIILITLPLALIGGIGRRFSSMRSSIRSPSSARSFWPGWWFNHGFFSSSYIQQMERQKVSAARVP